MVQVRVGVTVPGISSSFACARAGRRSLRRRSAAVVQVLDQQEERRKPRFGLQELIAGCHLRCQLAVDQAVKVFDFDGLMLRHCRNPGRLAEWLAYPPALAEEWAAGFSQSRGEDCP